MITTQTKTFSAGINTDVSKKFQPENSYRWALNAVLESNAGNNGSIINELGNIERAQVPSGYSVIGHVLLEDEQIVLFSTNNTSSEIGIYNGSTEIYSTWVNASCLNFSTHFPITALFRIARGCDRIIYFTDGVNPYRSINLDKPQNYTVNGVFDCNQIAFKRTLQVPKLEVIDVNDGGGDLKVGSYQFAIRYLDEDLNPTNWFYVTLPINIYDDAQASDYATINGALHNTDPTGTEALGVVNATSKSVNISLTDLDETFNYYQIAVIAGTGALGTVNEVFILPRVAIDSSTTEYLYSGNSVSGITQTDISDIIVDNFIPYIVEAHTQLDNRLYVGGLKSEQLNWAALQQAANNIQVNWAVETVAPFSQTVLGNAKNPLTPHKKKSFAGDEILCLGIEYLFDTGEWAPVCNIPGRVKIAGDDDLSMTFIPTNPDIQHLPLPDGQTSYTFEKWEVYNTAKVGGVMGYYEADSDYPDTVDCEGNRVYPEGKIRHHRMPCRKLVPIYTTEGLEYVGLNFLGINVTNITYPLPNIVGHRIVMGKRDLSNTTVLDTGLLTGANPTNTASSVFDQMPFGAESSETVVSFLSPKTMLGKPQNGSYFKMLKGISVSPTPDNPSRHEYPVEGNNSEFEIFTTYYEYIGTPFNLNSSTENRTYSAKLKIQPRTIQQPTSTFDLPIQNESYSNAWSIFKLTTPTNSQTGLVQVANKKYLRPYSSLENINYIPTHNAYRTLSDTSTIFGGDCYISELRIMDIWDVGQEGFFSGGLFERDYKVYANFLNRTWVESTINYELFHPGDDTCNSIYISGNRFGDYLINKVAVEEASGEYTARETVCKEYYAYNSDYSKINEEETAFGLSDTFDFCSGCVNEFPNRIFHSEKSASIELSDNYRYFKANNFTDDIDGSTGNLTALFTDKDKMYALTSNSAWFIPTSQQRITTNESNIYVGAADIFSIPARRLNSTDTAYGGCIDKLSIVPSEYGTFYVDSFAKKVFHLSDSMGEISNHGLRNFFANNLGKRFDLFFQKTYGTGEYPIKHPTDINGLGIVSTYDARYRRLILTKKDYTPLDPANLYWEPSIKRFYVLNGDTRKYVNLTDPEYFQDLSYTLSYSLPHKGWASYHSYLPNYYFRSKTDFFSTKFGNERLWEHNKGGYQTYYDTKKDHIIDFTFAKDFYQTKYFNTLRIVSDVYDIEDTRILNSFWDRMLIYNSAQSTGLQTLVVKNSADLFSDIDTTSPQITFANRVEGHWNISEIRDYATDHSTNLFSTSWDDIKNDYYIDKVPSSTAINFNKTLFDLAKLKDQYASVRLYFNPTENQKIVTDIVTTFTKISDLS